MCEKKQNAVKHGVFAEAIILPGENIEEFAALYDELKAEWCPEGSSQHDKVLSIAKNRWRKLRIARYHKKNFRIQARFREAADDLLIYEVDSKKEFLELVESGAAITEQDLSAKLGVSYAKEIQNKFPRKNYDSDSAWLSVVTKTIRSGVVELCKFHLETISVSEFPHEDFVLRELALEERIDAKIDKDIRGLMQLKAFQEINSRSVSITIPPTPAPLKGNCIHRQYRLCKMRRAI